MDYLFQVYSFFKDFLIAIKERAVTKVLGSLNLNFVRIAV